MNWMELQISGPLTIVNSATCMNNCSYYYNLDYALLISCYFKFTRYIFRFSAVYDPKSQKFTVEKAKSALQFKNINDAIR